MAEFGWAAFLGDEEVPVWFLLGASGLLFLVLYRLHYLWKQQLEYDVLKMPIQQDASISLWAGGSKESRGNCLFAGHLLVFFQYLGIPFWTSLTALQPLGNYLFHVLGK